MLRNIGAVILGYILFALLLFLTFSAAYLLMGANVAFKPASYEPSSVWLVTELVLGFVATVIAGYVCASLARGNRIPLALALLILVLGLLFAIPVLRAAGVKEQRSRSSEVSNMEAMQNAVQPAWMALLNPFLGAAGVMVGANLRRKKPRSS